MYVRYSVKKVKKYGRIRRLIPSKLHATPKANSLSLHLITEFASPRQTGGSLMKMQ